MQRTKKYLLTLIMPFSLLPASLWLYANLDQFTGIWLLLLPYLPYGLFSLGVVFSLVFNRSRIGFPLLLFGICLLLADYGTAWGWVPVGTEALLYNLFSILLPLNLLIFSWLKERGFFTLWGLLKFAWLGVQTALLLQLSNGLYPELTDRLLDPLLPSFLTPPLDLPHLALIFIVLALGYFLYRMILKSGDGFSAAVLLLIIFPLVNPGPLAFAIFWSAAALVLCLAIAQESYRMSYLDELTGLPARRALKDEMLRLSGTYTIAMVDIDFFKKCNDRHGHDIGDEVLKMVAATLAKVTGGGKAYRYGGEEFALVFSGKSLNDTFPHLESLRERVSQQALVLPGRAKGKAGPGKRPSSGSRSTGEKRLSVTVSIGAAQRGSGSGAAQRGSKSGKGKASPGSTNDPMTVLKQADQALYRAKKKGRNCVCK